MTDILPKSRELAEAATPTAERLREYQEAYDRLLHTSADAIGLLRDEVERLRTALRTVVADYERLDGEIDPISIDNARAAISALKQAGLET